MNRKVEPAKLQQISVVREFGDVFLKELPRLPPEREVGFYIELILRTSPIFIAPYCLAPSELRELKV